MLSPTRLLLVAVVFVSADLGKLNEIHVVTHGDQDLDLLHTVRDEFSSAGIKGVYSDGVGSSRNSSCLTEKPSSSENVLEISRSSTGFTFTQRVGQRSFVLKTSNDAESIRFAVSLIADQVQSSANVEESGKESNALPEGFKISVAVVLVTILGFYVSRTLNLRSEIGTLSSEKSSSAQVHDPICIIKAVNEQLYNDDAFKDRAPLPFDNQLPLSPVEFKEAMDAIVDFIIDYADDNGAKYSTDSKLEPGFLWKTCSPVAPDSPEKFSDVLNDFIKVVLPGLISGQNPKLKIGTSFADILAETLSTCFAVGMFTWDACPAATELEIGMVNWFGRAIGLPEPFLFTGDSSHRSPGCGAIHPSATDAVLVSLMVSRSKRIARILSTENLEKDSKKEAELLARMVAYASEDRQPEIIDKASKISMVRLHRVPTDGKAAMCVKALEAQIEKDLSEGLIPFYVYTTSGTTALVAFDNLDEIGQMAEKHNLWMHVDAAYGGSAWICEEFRHFSRGIERAHSVNVDCNKFFLQSSPLSYLWTRDRESIAKAFDVKATYLKGEHTTIDLRDLGIQLSRRLQGIKMWITMRMYGVKGIQSYIRRIVHLTAEFRLHLESDHRIETIGEQTLGAVCFKLKSESLERSNSMTRCLASRINESSAITVTTSESKGIEVIRAEVAMERTTKEDIDETWRILKNLVDDFFAHI